MIEAHRKQLFSMFDLRRGLFFSAKDFYFMVVLFCAIFVLISCKEYSSNEAEAQLEFDACNPYTGNFPANSLGEFDDHVGSFLSRYSVEQDSLENICPHSNLFCFPSTLTEFSVNEVGSKSETTEASGIQSEVSSSRLEQVRSNLSWPTKDAVFMVLDGRVILCSSYKPDDFNEFPYMDVVTKNGQKLDLSTCFSTLLGHETHSSKLGENAETVKSTFLDGISRPPVEVNPVVLDWGQTHLYYPALACLTMKNLLSDSILSIHYPYSSNSQFYPCNFSEISLAPGEMESICFVFSPRKLGLSSAQLVLQTSFGGFLIQAKGFAVESPYFVKPISGFNISSNGRWRKNLSLFNPFNEALYVEEITAWISTSSGNASRLSKAICNIHSMEDSHELSSKKWLDVESAEGSLPEIAIRPHKSWEVASQETETIMELDISDRFEGKIAGAFCLQLLRSSENKIETVVVPLEAELERYPASDTGYVSVSLEALIPCSKTVYVVALLVRNDGRDGLSVIQVRGLGDGVEKFQVKTIERVLLFPRSVTQVAVISYDPLETDDVDMNCKLIVQINDTRSSQIEIPCTDVISACAGSKLDSTVRDAQGIINVDYIKGREQSSDESLQTPTEIKAVDTREADELVLKNWKSQARASFISVLDTNEVLFPMVQVGNHCSQWIAVKNPSEEPIVVQFILNSGEVIEKCRTGEMHLEPSSSSTLAGNKSIAPTRYGFSIAKDAVTEALIHPYGSASFGPILFQPSNRCEWRSSALIRNNLSGVEWLSLRGLGGSLSLVLLEGPDPVQSLEFKMNLPSQLNFSSPEILRSIEAKRPSCCHPLIRDVYAKNMGDFPLEVIRIEVSGSECGLDGFKVHNCRGFTLLPGDFVMLQISYQSDFSTATMQRDLELALSTGILVIPMKATLPIHLFNFCKRSIFWTRLKKIMIAILFAALLLLFLVSLLFVMPSKMNGSVRSIKGEKALLMEPSGGCILGGQTVDEDAKPSVHDKHKKSLMDNLPETRLTPFILSNFPSVENCDAQAESDSRILRVRIGKEKGRRRRKKKSSGMRVPGLFEVSSSQSSNSTPSSPLSPATSITPKRPWPAVPLDTEQTSEARSPFAQQNDKKECFESSSKVVNLLKNEVAPKNVSNPCLFAVQKSNYTRNFSAVSPIAPHARAPGTKLHNKIPGEVEKKMDIEEKFTYNIWGDHYFELPMAFRSKQASPENNSESFFLRDLQALMTDPLLKTVSSDSKGNK